MKTWKEIITEEKKKGPSSYQDYLNRQLDYKIKKHEEQKKAQIERLKKRYIKKHIEKAKMLLSKIKSQTISSKDKEGTAYFKAMGNVGSAAAGVAGAAAHGTKAYFAKRKADAEAKEAERNQPNKKEKKSAGRPPTIKENNLNEMKTWKEIITEAESKRDIRTRTAVQKLADAEDPDFAKNPSLQSKEKREKYRQKKASEYTQYLNRQHEFKVQKYEDQKKAQIEKLRKKGVEQHAAAAKASLSGIKTQQISSQDKEGTAYSKAMGNVGSAAAGVAGAAINRLKQARAQNKADAEAKAAAAAQPEKKEPGAPGRPPTPTTSTPPTTPVAPASKPSGPTTPTTPAAPATKPFGPKGPSGPSGPAAMRPKGPSGPSGPAAMRPKGPGSNVSTGQKPTAPARTAPAKRVVHKAPTAFGFPVGRLATATAVAGKTLPSKYSTMGRGGENAFSRKIDKANTVKRPYKGNTSNIKEKYSNWREEFLFEIDDFGLKDNKKEKGEEKIIDVMKGKNTIDINPNETSVKEEVSGVDTQQNPNQANDLEKKQKAIQRQILLKKIQSLSVPGPTDITASYDSRIQEAHKDEEGGMANNELSTVERAIKSLRKKIKSSNQQLPAWVQSKITKAADYIDTAADYMSGETEPVEEAYDDENETFRQHSRERFTAEPADDDKAQKTSRILQRMKEMNKDAKPKKKKKKTKIAEEGPVLSVGRGEKLSVERGGGLTQKGRDKYNRATGSNLQAPVTGDVKPGSKAAQRRKNFCSRSRSWKGERGLAARRRWKC